MKLDNRGQTLIEMLIAAVLLVVVLTVMVSAVVAAMANNRLAKEKVVAVRLAQSGQDWFRGQRDVRGWGVIEAFSLSGTEYCIPDTYPNIFTLPTYSCLTGDQITVSNVTYHRRLTVTGKAANTSLDYTIRVTWDTAKSGGEFVEIKGRLTKWQ